MVTERLQVYKCPVCDTMIEVLEPCGLEISCCGPPMIHLDEKVNDAGKEEHVPLIERCRKGIRVKVGGARHPMEELHRIEWIELCCRGKFLRQYLRPGQAPEAVFEIKGEPVMVRAYCSRHGLWKAPLREQFRVGGAARGDDLMGAVA